jgi:tRNA (guanine26-N2/guanine27-N2)-dimethyltransferase
MYKLITEGKTELLVPVQGAFGKKVSGKDRKPPIFYNPHMALNRGLNVLFLQAAGKSLVFADALSGSGAKGIRIAVESGNMVFLNDANPKAVELMEKNAELNKVKVTISNLDAGSFLIVNKGVFDFIDIDPFGTPVPFVDPAFLSLNKKGFIGATATDTATLCGVYPDTCLRRYLALPLRSDFCHEVGIRILLGYLARMGAKYGKGVQPVLSHSTRHYLRCYIRVVNGVKAAKQSIRLMGYIYYCKDCRDFTFEKATFTSERTCRCGGNTRVSGPIWLGEIKENPLLKKMLYHSTSIEKEKLLTTLLNEVEAPFYYNIHKLAKDIKESSRGIMEIIEDLRESGFMASRTHFSPVSIKTNATAENLKNLLS